MQGCLIPLFFISFFTLLLGSTVQAQSPSLDTEERDMIRVTRHPDGAKAIYKRESGQPGMLCMTYTPGGKLAAINEYIEGKYGQLVGCRIYGVNNGKRSIIYKVSYGYDKNARLIEERMYSNPDSQLVQRVIYKYDAEGNRAKPIIVSLNRSNHLKEITPTMRDDVNKINQEAKKLGK